jgi:hypothetical protein
LVKEKKVLDLKERQNRAGIHLVDDSMGVGMGMGGMGGEGGSGAWEQMLEGVDEAVRVSLEGLIGAGLLR